MYFRIAFMISFISLCFTNTHGQAAPDLGILWQKNIGVKVKFAKFSHDGKFMYLADDIQNKIFKMSVESGVIISIFNFTFEFSPNDFNISKYGEYLVVTIGTGKTYVFDLETESMIKEISGNTVQNLVNTYCADIGIDENTLYIGASNEEGYFILVYNLIEDKEIIRINIEEQIQMIKVSHNGKYLATGLLYFNKIIDKGYNRLIIRETESLNNAVLVDEVEGLNSYQRLKFSPNDFLLGTARIPTSDIRIFDLNTKALIKSTKLDVSKGYFGLEFLPDNEHFLLSWHKLSGSGESSGVEIYNLSEKVKDINFGAPLIESFDSNGFWKIYCGNSGWATILSNSPTHVLEFNPDKKINLIYNNDKIILNTNESALQSIKIGIFDIKGKIIFSNTIENPSINSRYSYDLYLLSGLYVGKIYVNSKEYSFKITVAR